MRYKGYDVYEENGIVIISQVSDFDPTHVFECGQTFRWIKQHDGTYTGVVEGKVINVAKVGSDIVIKNTNIVDFKNQWFDYFDLGRNYAELKEKLQKDNHMRDAIKFGHGIRIIKQNFHEMLISFIISANNRIPMIMRTIERMSESLGSNIEFDGKIHNKFPDIQDIASAPIELLQNARMGFRAKYVSNTAKKVVEEGISEMSIQEMNTESAIKTLMTLPGVGGKVAACVLLFSGLKYDVFPTDVWVKRVMEELYMKKETPISKILEFANDYFGEYCGFAQQYLFYYAREKKIGTK